MYAIAVCDDEPVFVRMICDTVRKLLQQWKLAANVDGYDSAGDLLARLEGGICYDALLLDIDMPDMDGIELCRRFRTAQRGMLVVFVSNKEEMVFQTFEVQPFRFVRKRRLRQEISSTLLAVTQELNRRQDKWLRFHNETDGTVYSVNIRKLLYIEAQGKYCNLVSEDGNQQVRHQLQIFVDKLEGECFIQVHRSYLVNPHHIYRIDADTVLLDTGATVPISRRRRNQIKEDYFRWSVCEG